MSEITLAQYGKLLAEKLGVKAETIETAQYAPGATITRCADGSTIAAPLADAEFYAKRLSGGVRSKVRDMRKREVAGFGRIVDLSVEPTDAEVEALTVESPLGDAGE